MENSSATPTGLTAQAEPTGPTAPTTQAGPTAPETYVRRVLRKALRRLVPQTELADAAVFAVLFAASLAVMAYTFSKRLNLLDEGFILYASERVANGEVPYRDFFTLLMPGTFVLHAALMKLFGTSVMACRWAILVVGTALPLVVYSSARRVLPRHLSLFAGALAIAWGVSYGWVLPTYSWYGSLLSLLSLYWALRAHESGWTLRDGIRVGIFLGLTVLFKQNYGVYAAGAIAICLVISRADRLREVFGSLAVIGAAAALVNTPFVIWIAASGGMSDMIMDAVTIPLTTFRENMALPYPSIWPLYPPGQPLSLESIAATAKTAVAAIPVLYAVYFALWVWGAFRLKRAHSPSHLLIVLFASTVFLAAFPRADLGHVLFPMPAGFIVLAMLIGALRPKAVSAALSLIIAVPMIVTPLAETASWNRGCTWQLLGWHRADGIRMPEWEAAGTQQVLDAIDRYALPGESMFVIPWAAMFYFLSERGNPTRYDLLIPGNYPNDAEDEMIADLERKKPKLVIHSFVWDVDGKRFQDYLPRLHEYVRANYTTAEWVGQYEFLVLN